MMTEPLVVTIFGGHPFLMPWRFVALELPRRESRAARRPPRASARRARRDLLARDRGARRVVAVVDVRWPLRGVRGDLRAEGGPPRR